MIRFVSAASMLALAVAPAFAKDVKETRTFTKANGTEVVSHDSFHTRTGVTDVKVSKTRTDSQIRTVSEKIAPNHQDGFTVSKSVTGFNGQTHSSTSTVGAGHSASAGSHGGHGKA